MHLTLVIVTDSRQMMPKIFYFEPDHLCMEFRLWLRTIAGSRIGVNGAYRRQFCLRQLSRRMAWLIRGGIQIYLIAHDKARLSFWKLAKNEIISLAHSNAALHCAGLPVFDVAIWRDI